MLCFYLALQSCVLNSFPIWASFINVYSCCDGLGPTMVAGTNVEDNGGKLPFF
jgi:hypothetical protein